MNNTAEEQRRTENADTPWVPALFQCPRCPSHQTLGTELELTLAHALHDYAHALVDAMAPDLRTHVGGILTSDD